MIEKENIKTIAIFRALQLGDLLCSIPAIRALRRAFPEAHIAIVGLPWQKTLLERFPNYFDEFIHFPGYPGLPEQPFNAELTARFLLEMTRRCFDLVLQMQGNGTIVNPMVELLGSRNTAGFYLKGDYKPANGSFMEYPNGISEIHRHLLLMEFLGIENDGDHLEFPVTEKDQRDLDDASLSVNAHKYICVHAGSRGAYRQWPPRYFADAANLCHDKGFDIVLTGTKEEMNVVNEVASYLRHEPVIAAGKTNIGAMAALLQYSGGLISNCTGVSHVASALKVKSVVISMDGEPERWAPLNKQLHATIDWTRKPDYELVMRTVDEQFSSLS
jgi:ADP-heptose:LPS heptosyltransferase